MRHGSLFSGIGGFDIASEWMGWDNIFHCDINPFAQKVLKYYWPEATLLTDIKTTDFKQYEGHIDILTGGFPCQPYSTAGKRRGREDERHLWPEMLRSIREIKPRWVVGENVRGIISWDNGLVFDEVCSNLEAEGYTVFPVVLPAASVNAPHKRERVWFIAFNASNSYSNGYIREGRGSHGESKEIPEQHREEHSTSWKLSRTSEFHNEGSHSIRYEDSNNVSTYSSTSRLQERLHETNTSHKEETSTGVDSRLERTSEPRTATDSGQYSRRRKEQENLWADWPTQSPLCGGDDGLPLQLDGLTFSKWRQEAIKGYGNAIVPQVVLQIFKTIELYEATLR
jgi:DNA (cytosine-5)-methyltransferase 1